jgi:hypothetical protein
MVLTYHNRGYCYWWDIIPSDLSFTKQILVGWLSGSWTQKCWLHFSWRPWRLWQKWNHFGRRPPWLGKAGRTPFELYPDISLQVSKSKQNLSQGWWVFRDYSLHRLDCLWGTASADLLSISSPRSTVMDLNQPFADTKAFEDCELRGSPYQLTLSRNSQPVLWCGSRKNVIPKSSRICLLPTCTKVC